MPKLNFTSSPLAHQSYELILEKTTVGRGDQNTLIIHDPSLSGTHCEILMHGQEVIVHDLDSRNGTYVNGERLHNTQAPLKHGQAVRFGSVEARLELEDVSGESTASDITAIHAFGRAIRDQRREEKKPKPTNVSQHIGADAPDQHEDKTITMAVPLSATLSASLQTAQPVTKPDRKREVLVWIVICVIVLVMTGLAWRVMSHS